MSARLLLHLIVVVTIVRVDAQFDNSTCGIEKGCVWSSPGCDPATNCAKAFSWKVVGDYLQMELTGVSSGGTINYIAVGFSSGQSMGGQGVTDCTFGGSAGPATHLSYNNGFSNARITDYPYLSNHLQLMSGNVTNGRLYCAIRQLIVPQQSNSQIPTLNSQQFYLLMPLGTANDQGLNQHSLDPTNPSYPYVSGQVNLTDLNYGAPVVAATSTSVKGQLIKAHGIMMMLAWFIFVATAIMFARYFRGHWPDTKPMGLLLWFHFHRTLNMTAVLLMIAAFVCIFTAFGWTWVGPPQNPAYWPSTHSMVGLLAVVLAWVQPIGAIFRCHPGKPLRPMFNWLHRFAGLSAWMLAAAAITIAVVQFPCWGNNSTAAFGLVIAYLVFIGVVLILQEVITIYDMIKARSSTHIEVLEMQAPGKGLGSPLSPTTPTFTTNSKTKLVRLMLMGLFMVIGWGLAIALIVLLAIA